MSAGHSAADVAARSRFEAEQAEYAAFTARAMHENYVAASASEARLGALLEPLADQGFHVLHNRLSPGSQQDNVDYVIVGPSGVIIIDARTWGDVALVDGRVLQGVEDVTDRVEDLGLLGFLAQTSLAEIGLGPGEVRVVSVFMGTRGVRGRVGGVDLVSEDGALDYILNRGARLRPSAVDAAFAACSSLFEVHMPTPSVPSAAVIVTEDEVERALLSSIHARPIEDWMAMIHPDQARLARRSFNGPSRIRGAAGTGKTVVGMHRAAYLARNRPGRVLVTTLVDTLPVVLSSKMSLMAPDVADRIEFMGVQAFAAHVLESRGIPFVVSPAGATLAFTRAWAQVGASGLLGSLDARTDYWRDEILSVIKGRGLRRFDDYVSLARTGRRRALGVDARQAVWELYSEYNIALRELGVNDEADIILLAARSLHATPLLGYSAVIVDEAQDLSCSMIRMLHELVGDAPDGLNLIGDGQQTIYPGGYTLAEADVSIAGRGVVMTRNYRNTVEIAEFASLTVAGDDIDEAVSAPPSTRRHGARPRVSRFHSQDGHDRSLVLQVQSLIANGSFPGDIAVLTGTSFAAAEVTLALSMAGINSVSLDAYDGRVSSAVKVGTIKHSKGLEFKQVLVARASSELLETVWSSSDDVEVERRELERRELYVAVTRARDGVWVGVA
jgi:hypothetical protein